MLPSVHIEASGFIYSFLISSQWLLMFSKVINGLTTAFFRKWRVPLQLFALFSWQPLFFFPFSFPFTFWPVLPSSLLFFWKGLEHMSLSISVMKTDRKREGMRKCLMINKLQKIFHMHLNYTYSPRSKFPWLVWGSICNAKKAVLRPMWNIKMKSFSLKCDITEPRPGSAKFLSKVINFYVWWEDSWKSIGT